MAHADSSHTVAATPATRVSERGREHLALGLFGATAAMTAAALGLYIAASGAVERSATDVSEEVVYGLAAAATPLLGVILAVRRPSNAIGWLFLAGGLAVAYATFSWSYALYGLAAHPGSLPAASWVLWTGVVGYAGYFLPAVFALLLFPTGRLPSPRWRVVLWTAAVAAGFQLAAVALHPGVIEDFEDADIANPAGIEALGDLTEAVMAITGPVGALAGLAGAVSLVIRYRRSSSSERAQLAFFGVAVAAFVTFALLGNTVGGGYGENVVLTVITDVLLQVGLPAAVAAAVLWRGLYGIERVVHRTVVYGTMWTLVAATCAAVAWIVGVTLADRASVGTAVLSTMAAMIVLEPARRRLARLARKLVFGPTGRGYDLAADFSATVDDTGDLGELAGRLAELVCRGLDTRWARASLRVASLDAATAQYAAPRVQRADGDAALSVPITHRDAQFGTIECGAKLEGTFADHDRKLLQLLAKEAALAAHGIGLTDSLQRHASELEASRSRIVTAQEVERRRIERNIHDGAQQELVALIAKVRLARDLVARDPAAAAATLEEVQADARTALRDIRELAQGIHPTVLADQGLVRAIEDRANRLPIDVRIRVDPVTREARFDDAVEGAAFFVVSEALTNVIKHADAQHAVISIARHNGTLDVAVSDDGRGLPATAARRTGIEALADRIEALGGRLEVSSEPGAGTLLHASVPVRPPEEHRG